MARKPRIRNYEKKMRGNKRFDRENAGLIRNLAGDAGLLATYTEVKKTSEGNLVNVPVGKQMPKRVTPEMRDLAKGYGDALPAIRKELENRGKRSEWATLRRRIQSFDCIHNTQIWTAFEIWMKQNPAFSKLNPRKRILVAASTLDKMLCAVSNQHTMAGTVKRLDSVTGIENATQKVAKAVSESQDYKEIIKYIREIANLKIKDDKEKAIKAYKDYDYGMR